MKKYELTSDVLQYAGHTLHRIKALKDFGFVKARELGGLVESEENLSHDGDCWVYDDAKVYGDAKVFDNAMIYDSACVYDDSMVHGVARVCDNVMIRGNAEVCGDAEIYGNAILCYDAKVSNNTDYIVFKNFWSSGRYFTWTRSNNMWSAGCFYGTGEELIKKAYADSEKSGREYERVVRYVESILADKQKTKHKFLCTNLIQFYRQMFNLFSKSNFIFVRQQV